MRPFVMPSARLARPLLAAITAAALVLPSFADAGRVRGYYRKNGTYVAPHNRGAQGSASSNRRRGSSASTRSASRSSGQTYSSRARPPAYVERDANGRIRRSSSARAAFRRSNPCPSTGSTTGPCPGYEVDHVNPLACGGADAPANMQWLSATANRQKGSMGCGR